MSTGSKIEWTETTWNPVTGCTKASPGCANCYAEKMAHRLKAMGQAKYANEFTPTFHPEALSEPLKWRKPRRVFVVSMGDLFHDAITDEQIAAVFGAMAACPQHTFQVLTKRAERMRRWFEWIEQDCEAPYECAYESTVALGRDLHVTPVTCRVEPPGWPLPNVWIGTTAEDQQRADERIPHLLATPAAVRFVSCEPLLGPVDIGDPVVRHGMSLIDSGRCPMRGEQYSPPSLDWVIAGGESGPGARPCSEDWIRQIVTDCGEAGVACFVKQLGGYPRKRKDPNEWPEDLRVRQWPETVNGARKVGG